MTTAEEKPHTSDMDWEQLGRAAEEFARRVARDARKFAERIEEHASEFAHDVARDWRRTRRMYRHGCGHRTPPDVRLIFEDVRGVLTEVLDGVDELISRVFGGQAEASETQWTHVVHNRQATCSSCGRTIVAGEEGYVRRTAHGLEWRCIECGVASTAAGAEPPPAA